jgi:hypothetical protein
VGGKGLPVRVMQVLLRCEPWFVTLTEENKLRVFENQVLRKICGARRVEVTGEWRRLHNGEVHGLYCRPDIIRVIKSRRMRWAGHVARMEREVPVAFWWGSLRKKTPLGRPRLDSRI